MSRAACHHVPTHWKTTGSCEPLGRRHEVNIFENKDADSDNGSGTLRFIRIECPGVGLKDIKFSKVANGLKAGLVEL